MGVLRALKELGLAVPEAVKIVGFDDIAHAAYMTPTLTTVHIDKAQLGREAVRTLVGMVRDEKDVLETKKVVRAALVKRESA